MKKIWSILMAAMILCLAVRVPSLAEGAPTLELRPSVSTVQPGGEFTVDLVIHNNPGIAGIRFVFQYDEALLQLKEVTFDKKTFDWEVCYKEDPTRTDEVSREGAAWAQKTNWTGNDCSILQLTFRVLENAPMDTVTTIGITDLDIMNASLQEIPFTAAPAIVTIQEEPPGVTVSGTVTSYGDTAEKVTVTLLQGETTAGTWRGTTGPYTISNVAPGPYTLRVEKKGHAPWAEVITVGADDVIGKNISVYMYGDVNRNGVVTSADVLQISQKIAGMRDFDEYQLLLADVNHKNGITSADSLWTAQRVAGIRDVYFNLIGG